MPLPKTQHPIVEITQPSTTKKLNFRPFVTREEKILLMGQQTGDKKDISLAIRQVVNNCCQDKKFDVSKLTTFDLDYLFIKLRAASVDNMVEVTYEDPLDKEEYKLNVDLNKVVVEMANDTPNTVKQGDITIKLKYPNLADLDMIADVVDASLKEETPTPDVDNLMIAASIDAVYDKDEKSEDFTLLELAEWIDDLHPETSNALRTWVNNVPDLVHTISYKRVDGSEGEVVLRGMEDFFIL